MVGGSGHQRLEKGNGVYAPNPSLGDWKNIGKNVKIWKELENI
jgi:hypothetical protein